MNRREFLGITAIGAASITAAGLGVTKDIIIEERTIPLQYLHEDFNGYRIGFISDLHLSGVTSIDFIQNTLQSIVNNRINLLILGGDYTWIPSSGSGRAVFNLKDDIYRNFSSDELPNILHSELRQILFKNLPEDGLIAILGNHDLRMHPTACLDLFSETKKVRLLRNEIHTIKRNRGALSIIGVEDYLTSTPKLPSFIPQDHPTLLLAHNPDYASELIEQKKFKFAGALCGHTHGGQIRIPGLGPIALNISDSRFAEGLTNVGGSFVMTSRGLGVVGIPFRINCPPEAHILNLVPA